MNHHRISIKNHRQTQDALRVIRQNCAMIKKFNRSKILAQTNKKLAQSETTLRVIWDDDAMQTIIKPGFSGLLASRRKRGNYPKKNSIYFVFCFRHKFAAMKENFSLRPEKSRFAFRRGPPINAWNIKQLRALPPAQPQPVFTFMNPTSDISQTTSTDTAAPRRSSLLNIEAIRTSGVFPHGHEPSVRTLRSWVKRRYIPHKRIGGQIFFDPDAVERHLHKNLDVPARQ